MVRIDQLSDPPLASFRCDSPTGNNLSSSGGSQKEQSRHIVFLKPYLYIKEAREVSAWVFTLICALCFDKTLSKGEQRILADPNSAAPRSPAASQQFSERSCIKGVGAS